MSKGKLKPDGRECLQLIKIYDCFVIIMSKGKLKPDRRATNLKPGTYSFDEITNKCLIYADKVQEFVNIYKKILNVPQ